MKNLNSKRNLSPGRFLLTAALISAPLLGYSQTQDYWQGGTGDFGVATNWTLGVVPISGYAANNDSGSNNISYITATDPSFTFNGYRDGVSASGAFVQNGDTVTLASTQNGWLRMGLNAGSIGYYTIASNAILNSPYGITVGELGMGVLNVYGGTITLGTGNDFIICDNGQGGVVNQTNGAITCGSQLWLGQGTGSTGVGTYNLSGGTLTENTYFAIGRDGGTGILNMTGGTIYKNNSGTFLVGTTAGATTAPSTGTVNQSGGTINSAGQILIPEQSSASGTFNLSGTGVVNVSNYFAVGRGGVGTFNISGGVLSKTDTGNTDHIDIGAGGSSSGTGPGTINQTGGMITNTTSDFYLGEAAGGTWNISAGTNYVGNLIIAVGAGLSSTVNLNGGFLAAGAIFSSNPVSSFSTLNLNGGTLQALSNSTAFIYNLSSVSVQGGGVVFDTKANAVTIPQAITDGGGGGAVAKISSGTLILSGANSYAGPTLVNGGTLYQNTAASGGGLVTVADGAAFGVVDATQSGQLTASSLTLGTSAGASLNFNFASFTGSPSQAPLNVSGPVVLNGNAVVNIPAGSFTVGSIPLATYSSLSGSGSFVLGALPPGVQATLNVTANALSLVVTGASSPKWNGNVSSVWDIATTTNWLDTVTGLPTVYFNGAPVLFDDTATGTTAVTLNTTVQPGAMTVNNSVLTYSLSGSGVIAGATGLLKEGSNSLTLSLTANTFTGPVTLAGGTLSASSLANGGAASSIGASSANSTNLLLAGGTLAYTGSAVTINRGYMAENTNGTVDIYTGSNLGLSGTATALINSGFNKAGPAQLSYSGTGTNVLSGTLGYTVSQGSVLFGGSGSGLSNNINGYLYIGNAGSTNATVAVTNGSALNLVSTGNFDIGDSSNTALTTVGAFTQSGGTVNLVNPYQVFVGENSNGFGTFNLSGGTFNVDFWVAVGRLDGTGVMNISGGVLNIQGGNGAFDIGTSAGVGGAVGTGTVNQTGGIITNYTPTWLGEGATGQAAQGTWNMTGGTAYLIGSTGSGGPCSLLDGQTGIGTNSLNLSGTGVIICSNYVSLGHVSTVTGILNIGGTNSGGTFTMGSGSDFNVGDSGTGILNLGAGGKLTVLGTMYLTRGSTASGTVNLNGGTLNASFINNGYGFGNGSSANAQVFNFNGGTLKALTNTPYFIQPYVTTVVQSGGAIIDDGGFNITINSGLAAGSGAGGLTKIDTGTLYLNGTNTYTGTTTVSAGSLGVSSTGSIAGPVVISSGGTLLGDEGAIETYYINNSLTLASGSSTIMDITPASNDEIQGLTGVSYGGALIVTNTSTNSLTAGAVYKLFNAAAPGTGNFSSVTILPAGTGTFNPATGALTITSTGKTVVNAPYYMSGNLIFTGSGGTPGATYSILSTTNLAQPLSTWSTNTTGVFSSSGTFSNALPTGSAPAMFYALKTP